MPTLVQLFILFAAVVGSGVMAAALMLLWSRTRRLEEPERGEEALHALREELAATRETTRELAERLDFLERLLEAGPEERPRSGAPTVDRHSQSPDS